jgi:hypothetical protein
LTGELNITQSISHKVLTYSDVHNFSKLETEVNVVALSGGIFRRSGHTM